MDEAGKQVESDVHVAVTVPCYIGFRRAAIQDCTGGEVVDPAPQDALPLGGSPERFQLGFNSLLRRRWKPRFR